ncbi:MAG: hypothetical protein U0228_12105 [Myxococcaceae bacterium]
MALFAAVGCVTPEDQPTNVHDLRVLGMRFEPPEVLMRGCNAGLLLGSLAGAADGGSIMLPPQFQVLLGLYASTPLQFTALIADPKGNGRDLNYRLLGCANRGDRDCNNEGDYVLLEEGITHGGEFKTTVTPGIQFLDDGMATPLLLEVIQQDTFKGLGGIRVPVVLEVWASDTGEKIYAQKLMVYSCQFFPTMKQNITPEFRGIDLNQVMWPENEVPEVHGRAELNLTPIDFTDLQETYVVPTIQLKPLELTEAWKVTWMTTSGTMSPYNTGGTDFSGTEGKHLAKWKPDQVSNEPADVTFYFVVRDGRGGNSWITRHLKWFPD